MNEPLDTVAVIAVLVVAAIIVSMAVGLIYGMPKKYVPYFFAASFAIMAGVGFAVHWAFGAFVVIIGTGGVAAIVGVDRLAQRVKAASEEDTKS